MIKRKLNRIKVLLVAVASLALAATPPASAQPDDPRRPTVVNHYETPCYYRERVARGIPAYSIDRSRGLMAYVDAHLDGETPDAELAEFWAALRDCRRLEPVARWDWPNMIMTHREYIY